MLLARWLTTAFMLFFVARELTLSYYYLAEIGRNKNTPRGRLLEIDSLGESAYFDWTSNNSYFKISRF